MTADITQADALPAHDDPSRSEGLPDPTQRRRSADIRGLPLEIGEQTWLLHHAGLAPEIKAVRDRLYNAAIVNGRADLSDVMLCGYYMLHANYNLEDEEVARILWAAHPDELTLQVFEALFVPRYFRRNYSDWLEAALLVAGIDPAKVRPHVLPHVIKMLVETGRVPSAEEYTEAGEAAAKRAALLDFAQKQRDGLI